jgi:hypothetical protein
MSTDLTTTTPQRGQTIEGNSLTTRSETSRELSVSAAQTAARYEIEGAIILARQFPRNEDAAYQGLMRSCKRLTFAEDCTYSFPRGGEQVEGPSVYLARELARLWGNIRYGVDIIADDESERTIRAWAWDLETNTRTSADDTFAKLIYRKKGGWQKPDERDLRELTNRRAAIIVRNCLLGILPPDFVEDAMTEAKRTLHNGVSENIDESRKKLVVAFGGIGVSVEQIEEYLGHPIASSAPSEIANLRAVWKSISDGNSTWNEYSNTENHDAKPKQPSDGTGASASDLTAGKAAKTERPHKKSDKPKQEDASTEEFDPPQQEALAFVAREIKSCAGNVGQLEELLSQLDTDDAFAELRASGVLGNAQIEVKRAIERSKAK